LFNLGRVYELMGEYDRSIDAYEHLLTVIGPHAEEREQTEVTLERLRGARARATPPPTIEEVGSMDDGPTFVRERGVADEAFWAMLIGGGVVTLVAGGLGIGALTMRGQVDGWVLGRDGDVIDRNYVLSNAQAMGIAADVVGIIGGAAILAALGLFLFRERTYEVWAPGARLRFDVGPTGAQLAGTF
jgi:tetratricopeptide (TPR) repeat protein